MAQYNFEGDLVGISERQLEYINNILTDRALKNPNTTLKFEPVGKAGDNYIANVKRLIIDGENGKTSLVVKIAPTNEVLRMTMKSGVMFKNEHFMYTEVLPKLKQVQEEAEVPEDQQLKFAKCYGSLSEPPNEVIILEDLKTSNYAMLDRFESLSDACVKSFLKNFAILHSLSYALKKKQPETFDNYASNLIDLWSLTATVKESALYFGQLENEVLAILDKEEHKNVVRHKISEILNFGMKLKKVDTGSKYSVIQQGDSWTNNVMFKFEDDKVDSIMIDYQLSNESRPVSDILYMIFNCTDHKTRSKHFYDWIDYYHTELDNCLSTHGLKVNLIYPRDQLDADLKRYGKFLFATSVVLASVLTRKTEDAAQFKDAIEQSNGNLEQISEATKVTHLDDETIARFKNRIVGLVESFIGFGLL